MGRIGQIPWNKGLKNWMSEDGRKRMIASKVGKTPWNKGTMTKEEMCVRYRKNNPEKVKLWKKQYVERNKANPQYRLAYRIRGRILKALNGTTKVASVTGSLGCTLAELKFYIEGKFHDGMSWKNYGIKGWHLDHVTPLAFFDLTDKRQFLKACHYSNLQPLWAKDNLHKGKKLLFKQNFKQNQNV